MGPSPTLLGFLIIENNVYLLSFLNKSLLWEPHGLCLELMHLFSPESRLNSAFNYSYPQRALLHLLQRKDLLLPDSQATVSCSPYLKIPWFYLLLFFSFFLALQPCNTKEHFDSSVTPITFYYFYRVKFSKACKASQIPNNLKFACMPHFSALKEHGM